MDGLSLRQKAISENIANAGDPNYRPLRVDFGDYFKNALDEFQSFRGKTTQGPLSIDPNDLRMHFDFDPEFDAENNGKPRGDLGPMQPFKPHIYRENSKVDLNQEMADLAKTNIMYNAAAAEVTPSETKWIMDLFR